MKNMLPVSSSLKVTASETLDVSEDLEQTDKNTEELIKAYEQKEQKEETQDI